MNKDFALEMSNSFGCVAFEINVYGGLTRKTTVTTLLRACGPWYYRFMLVNVKLEEKQRKKLR